MTTLRPALPFPWMWAASMWLAACGAADDDGKPGGRCPGPRCVPADTSAPTSDSEIPSDTGRTMPSSLFAGAPTLLGPANPATTPLTNRLAVETTVPTTVSIAVDDGMHRWQLDPPGATSSHLHALAGFRPALAHAMTVTVRDEAGTSETWPTALVFETGPLPEGFPVFRVVRSDPARMEPGYTFFAANAHGADAFEVILAVDAAGDVVWYHLTDETAEQITRARSGNLLFNFEHGSAHEIDVLGSPAITWSVAPRGTPGEVKIDLFDLHHDIRELPDGSLLTLDTEFRTIGDFPTSEDDPDAPPADQVVAGGVVVNFARDGAILGRWSTFDLLDPLRIGRNSLMRHIMSEEYGRLARDWNHANAVFHDPRDDTFLVSNRHQDAVIKLDREGRLRWILAPFRNWHEDWYPYLLRPVGDTEYAYHQHACSVTPSGTILMFDNGNERVSAYEEVGPGPFYSRVAEFAVDPVAMTMEQVWEFRPSEPLLLAKSLGDADVLPTTGNVLATFGNLVNDPAMARLFEVTHTDPPEILWELEIQPVAQGYGPVVYRSERLPTLGPP